MNDEYFGYKIRQHLNRGLHELSPETTARLAAARQSALALFIGVIFSVYWVADQRATELGAIDSALLTDELPISAFTDQGFDAWLKRASPQ